MKSAVAMIAALLCAAACSVGAFVVPVALSTSVRTSSARRALSVRSEPSMSSVATPSQTSASTNKQRPANVQTLGSSDDYTNAMAKHQDKLVVVKFYDQFCGACDEIRPRFEDLSRTCSEEHAVFYQLEFSSSKKLCKTLGIRRLPTVQIHNGKEGRVADLPAGPSRFNQVQERLADLLPSKSSVETQEKAAQQ